MEGDAADKLRLRVRATIRAHAMLALTGKHVDLEAVRNVVVVIAGIIWTIVFLVLLALVLVVYALIRKYLGQAQVILEERVGSALDQAQIWAEALRVRTAGLPGHPRPEGSVAVALPPARKSPLSFPLFRRRRKWWQRILPS